MKTYAPKLYPPKDTPAWRLFFRSYPVMIQNRYLYPPEYVNKRGLVAGTAEEIQAFYDDYTATSKTAVAMIMLYEQGVEVFFEKIDDLVAVYNDLHKHLSAWADQIKQPFGMKPPPEEDLLSMDRFASQIAYAAENRLLELALTEIRAENYNRADYFAQFAGDGIETGYIGIDPNKEQHYAAAYESPIFDAWSVSPWRDD